MKITHDASEMARACHRHMPIAEKDPRGETRWPPTIARPGTPRPRPAAARLVAGPARRGGGAPSQRPHLGLPTPPDARDVFRPCGHEANAPVEQVGTAVGGRDLVRNLMRKRLLRRLALGGARIINPGTEGRAHAMRHGFAAIGVTPGRRRATRAVGVHPAHHCRYRHVSNRPSRPRAREDQRIPRQRRALRQFGHRAWQPVRLAVGPRARTSSAARASGTRCG